MIYEIYAGLKEPYGKAKYIKTSEYESEDHALQDAKDWATYICKERNALYGFLPTFGECLKEAELSEDTVTEEDFTSKATNLYYDYLEQYLDYYVKEIPDYITDKNETYETN